MDDPVGDRPSLTELVQGLIESRSIPSLLQIGMTGHRALEEGVERWVAQELDELFSYLTGLASGAASLRAVSSLATGADQLFAATALRYGIPLDIVLPFARFADDFPGGPERDAYQRLLSAAASTTWLPWDERSNGAYLAGGLWLVDHCDLLIAVWNGQKAAGVGGTGDVVDYCCDAGKPCVHMQTTNLRVEVLT